MYLLVRHQSSNPVYLFQMDWAAFGVMTIPSLCIPLMLWYSSKSKYDKYVQHKKTK